MSDNPESNDERPCLHCLIGDLIDEFYAQYGSLSGETDTIDVDEIITALAKDWGVRDDARGEITVWAVVQDNVKASRRGDDLAAFSPLRVIKASLHAAGKRRPREYRRPHPLAKSLSGASRPRRHHRLTLSQDTHSSTREGRTHRRSVLGTDLIKACHFASSTFLNSRSAQFPRLSHGLSSAAGKTSRSGLGCVSIHPTFRGPQ